MNRLLAPAAAAVAGAIVLAVCFPRFDPSAQLQALDHRKAIDRARALAARYGVNTAGWQAAVVAAADETLREYRAAYPADPQARFFSPVTETVALVEPGRKRSLQIALFADGRPASWGWDAEQSAVPSAPSNVTPQSIVADFGGSNAISFRLDAESEPSGLSRQRWVWQGSADAPLSAALTIDRVHGAVWAVRLKPEYLRKIPEARGSRVLSICAGLSGFLAFCSAIVLFLMRAFKRNLHYRVPLLLLAASVLWTGMRQWNAADHRVVKRVSPVIEEDSGEEQGHVKVTVSKESDDQAQSAAEYPELAGDLFASAGIFLFACVGLSTRAPHNREKWHSLELVGRGRIWNSTVGESLAVGLLGGVGVAAIPYAIAAARLSPGGLLFRSVDALTVPFVLGQAVRPGWAIFALGIFGWGFPVAARLKNRYLRWSLTLFFGGVFIGSVAPFFGLAPRLLAGALSLAAYLWIYSRSSLLASAVALVTARAAVVPCVLLWQPSLRDSGVKLLALGVLAIAGALHLAIQGREPGEEDAVAEPELPELDNKSGRERLQAEFQIARKAQQDALPAGPPVVDGYSFAAWCEPAQQVGGDLYDYFHLSGGRLGIAVADVSGKGVPAALYMMVTKGMLSAASGHTGDLAGLLEQINHHLYKACRKKVFVTMAAVVLDAEKRRFEYGRAGHNPILWRRVRRGETLLLKPAGLGLGMTASDRFLRNLRIEEFEMEIGDIVVLYSDGVTEAMNASDELFGERRLIEAVEKAGGHTAEGIRAAILERVVEFVGDAPVRDDITLVVVCNLPRQAELN